MYLSLAIRSALVSVGLVLIRLVYVIKQTGKARKRIGKNPLPVSTLIVLGSGGHTAEMLNLLSMRHKERFSPRFYVAAATDNMSLQKARLLENALVNEITPRNIWLSCADKEMKSSKFMQIYRSREVGQSYITSVWTTLFAIAHALWLMIRMRPQVVLCNGPGTCIPLCIIAFFFKVVGIRWSSVFYVEGCEGSRLVASLFTSYG